jgi:hypothetical protein
MNRDRSMVNTLQEVAVFQCFWPLAIGNFLLQVERNSWFDVDHCVQYKTDQARPKTPG